MNAPVVIRAKVKEVQTDTAIFYFGAQVGNRYSSLHLYSSQLRSHWTF